MEGLRQFCRVQTVATTAAEIASWSSHLSRSKLWEGTTSTRVTAATAAARDIRSRWVRQRHCRCMAVRGRGRGRGVEIFGVWSVSIPWYPGGTPNYPGYPPSHDQEHTGPPPKYVCRGWPLLSCAHCFNVENLGLVLGCLAPTLPCNLKGSSHYCWTCTPRVTHTSHACACYRR